MPPPADTVNLGERFCILDHIMMVNRHGLRYLEAISARGVERIAGSDERKRDPLQERMQEQIMEGADLDSALRDVHRWFDRVVAAMRLQDHAERAKQLDRIGEELNDLKRSLVARWDLAKLVTGNAQEKGKVIGDLVLCLTAPAVLKVQQAADRAEQVQRNLHLAFALAAYQRDHGRYPMSLDALAPKYLATVPQDLFTGKALVYRPSETGYLLYSFGVNGRDDEGRYHDDDPPGDDPSVRMPLPKLREKR
jgi:hypothetical protein